MPLPFHFSLSCIGEGNGNPLQCSCLENPRDGGAQWAAVYGVAQSRTRLKQLSSSSSSPILSLPLTSEVSCAPSFCRLNTYLKFVNLMALETWLSNSKTECFSLNLWASQLPGTRSQAILCLSTKPVQSLAGRKESDLHAQWPSCPPLTVPLRLLGHRVEHHWAWHPLCSSISAVQDQVCMTACLPGNTVFWMDSLFSTHGASLAAEQSAHTLCRWAWWVQTRLRPLSSDRWAQTMGDMARCPLAPNSDTGGHLGLEAATGCLLARKTDICFSGKTTTTTLCSQDGWGLPKVRRIAPVLGSCFHNEYLEALFSSKSPQHC